MRILVTGGGGFLGSRIAVALCQRGHQVVVLGRREYDHLKRWPITQRQGDIADRPVVEAACHGCDAVIHAAARAGLSTRWKPFFQANVLGTRTVLQAAIRACVPRFVYTSSPSVTFAGRSQAGVNESQALPPPLAGSLPAIEGPRRTGSAGSQRLGHHDVCASPAFDLGTWRPAFGPQVMGTRPMRPAGPCRIR
ncbi:MAG: hypothetical protein KatS3mg110_0395 [Pirellulaceae bacterium]|nr:MAG: hypothetical protein KatS3mg110_0395 [Pirellulaceae bacterium]